MKHEIEIPDLPEDWEAVAYKNPEVGEYYLGSGGIKLVQTDFQNLWLVVRKKQPRRIVLEETCKEDRKAFLHAGKYWKIVEDNK